jgi:hypothetical protein
LHGLAKLYVEADFPPVWPFDYGANGTVHNELRAAGLIKIFKVTGYWSVTSNRQPWIMRNRPADCLEGPPKKGRAQPGSLV